MQFSFEEFNNSDGEEEQSYEKEQSSEKEFFFPFSEEDENKLNEVKKTTKSKELRSEEGQSLEENEKNLNKVAQTVNSREDLKTNDPIRVPGDSSDEGSEDSQGSNNSLKSIFQSPWRSLSENNTVRPFWNGNSFQRQTPQATWWSSLPANFDCKK